MSESDDVPNWAAWIGMICLCTCVACTALLVARIIWSDSIWGATLPIGILGIWLNWPHAMKCRFGSKTRETNR